MAEPNERRRHHHLRDLIDEMLVSIRVATNRELISAEERADAERQLEMIMTRVHEEAMKVSGATQPG